MTTEPSAPSPPPASSAAARAHRALEAQIGGDTRYSDWLELTQDRVDTFAAATSDHQFIHVDPERAARTRFGGTIAHGFLTLALLVHLATTVPDDVSGMDGLEMEVNVGLSKVRFIRPVPVGSRIRLGVDMQKAILTGNTVSQVRKMSILIEGEDRPALVAEWTGQAVFA